MFNKSDIRIWTGGIYVILIFVHNFNDNFDKPGDDSKE